MTHAPAVAAPDRPDYLRLATLAGFILLALLCIAWECWLAPLRSDSWLLALKALPLLLAIPAIAAGKVRVFQWWSMLILVYLAEGLVRGASDQGLSASLGWIEAALAMLTYMMILIWCKRHKSGTQSGKH